MPQHSTTGALTTAVRNHSMQLHFATPGTVGPAVVHVVCQQTQVYLISVIHHGS